MSSVAITDQENLAANENEDKETDGKEDDGNKVQEEDKGEKTEENDTENVAEEHHEGEQLEKETLKEEGDENQEEDKIDETVEGEGNEEQGIEIKVEGEELDEDAEQEQTKDEEGVEEETVEEEKVEEEEKEPVKEEEIVEEEEPEYVEVPVDPAAPLNLTDSKDAMRADFELRPEQLAEVEKLWEMFQDYTPAYTDIADYITVKELVYMLEALLIMTYTEDQLMELVTFVCRSPDDDGHITYDQFLRMVKIRLRDMEIEEELGLALRVLDPGKTGEVEADELREVLGKMGNKLPQKMLDDFIKEIDLSGEGKIGIEDVVAICGMDLAREDETMGTTMEPDEEEEQA